VYEYIIELGKNLPAYPENQRIEAALIKGCQAKVWIYAVQAKDQLSFYGDSDSALVKGLVALLLRVFSEQKPATILHTELFFMDKIGLQALLSMNRANGLQAMIKQIKRYAFAVSNYEKLQT
jgi:cysteine desulfuration protein SufE